MRSISGVVCTLVLALAGPAALAVEEGELPENPMSCTSYKLDVEIKPSEASLTGTAFVGMRNDGDEGLSTLTFYLHSGLKVSTVTDSKGTAMQFRQRVIDFRHNYTGKALEVEVDLPGVFEPGKEKELEFAYLGVFHPSKATAESNFMRIDEEGCFLRSIMYSLWFPTTAVTRSRWSDSAVFELTATAPAGFKTLCCGNFLGETQKDGKVVSRWGSEVPIEQFKISLISSRYEVVESESDGLTLAAYYRTDQGHRSSAETMLKVSQRLLAFFKSKFNPVFSVNRMFVAEMPEYGDIISGNLIGLASEYYARAGEPSFSNWLHDTFAHEMAHYFSMPSLDATAPGWCFLVESIPCYTGILALQGVLDEEYYRQRLERLASRYLQGRETGLSSRGRELAPEKPILEIPADELGEYKDYFVLSDRGALIVHMLRYLIGDEAFYLGFRQYLASTTARAGTIDDFMKAMSDAGGEDLTWFFDFWLRKMEVPDFTVSDARYSTGVLEFKLANLSDGKMPVEVLIETSGAPHRERVWISSREEKTVRIELDRQPLSITLDPDGWLLELSRENNSVKIAGQ